MKRTGDKRGITVVEVLIALSVITSVLVGAYAVTLSSSQAVQSGQEQSEVLQLLQGQVEHVRALTQSQTSTTNGTFTPGEFCITRTQPHIRVNAGATACNDIKGLYDIRISYNSTDNVFTFVGSWDRIGGGTNREVLTYRVYSGAVVPISTSP